MIYTNEKVIIESEGNLEALEAAIVQVEEYLEASFPDLKFEFAEDPFPHYLVPPGIDFSHLKNVLGDEVKRRAINETVYDITDRTFTKEIKHYYSDRELNQKADELANAVAERDAIENRKKVAMHMFNEELKEMDLLISNLAKARREKHEMRKFECLKQLNLTDDKVYYIVDQEIVAVEEMEAKDRQMFISFDAMPMAEKAPGVEEVPDIHRELGVDIGQG